MIPRFLTHYHLRGAEPFRSISELGEEEWHTVYDAFRKRQETDTTYNRRFGPTYRTVRLEVEAILRTRFEAKGGITSRSAPHYFCLGANHWWKNFCDHDEIRIPLDEIDPRTVSFTYPDSFTSMGILDRFDLRHEKKPYHGEVFFLDELDDVIREFGMPVDRKTSDYTAYHKEDLELYIEAQLWTDDPIVKYKREKRSNRAS